MTVHRGDMLDSPAGAEGSGARVDLDRVAGCPGFQGPRDAHRIRSPGPPFRLAIRGESADRGDRLACDPVSDHLPDRGRRDLMSGTGRYRHPHLFSQLVLSCVEVHRGRVVLRPHQQLRTS